MILSTPSTLLGAAPIPASLALVALSAYAVAAWPGERRIGTWALHAAWGVHVLLLAADFSGTFDGRGQGPHIGFAPVLSLTVWLVLAVHAVESRFLPLPGVRRALAAAGVVAVLLAWLFPGETALATHSPLAPLHWLMGVASYGLFGAAVLHALLLDAAERQMRRRSAAPPLGMPLLQLEHMTFRFVEAGFIVLTLTLIVGVLSTTRWRWDHKTVLSLLGWAVFAALLAGRAWHGWRGRRATRWLYVGAGLLLLAYVGSRFVFEVVLGRPAP